jgi:ABC-type branched-subunit amino acid transport system substrate-binding protein
MTLPPWLYNTCGDEMFVARGNGAMGRVRATAFGCWLCWCVCCFFPPQARAADIVVGMSAAFTGPSRTLGIELYRGSMAYLEHVNRTGGINGRKILIKAYDDGYDPVPAVENTITLIERDKVFLLFGYVGTPTVTRILPLLKRYSDKHIYLFFPYTGAQPQREAPYDELVFNLRSSYRQETEGLVDHFVQVGRKRIAVFYQADAYGRSGWDGVRRALEIHDLKIVGEATYRRGTEYEQSFAEQVSILQKATPDAIISIGAYEAAAAFIRDARDAAWDIPIANVSFVGSARMKDLLLETGKARGKDYTTNLINSQVVPSYEDTSLPAVRQYRELMDAYNPMPPQELIRNEYEPLQYSFISFEGFLNAKLLVEILRRMGSTPETARVREVIETVSEYDIGIDVPVSFGPGKHQGLDTVYFMTVREGRPIPIRDWQAWAK